MTHSTVGYGPGYYVIGAFAALLLLMALFLIVDPMRPKRATAYDHYLTAGARKAPLFIYQIFGVAYVLISILTTFSSYREQLTMYSVFSIPIIFIAEVVYLLRVVYPKPLATPTSVEETINNDDGE